MELGAALKVRWEFMPKSSYLFFSIRLRAQAKNSVAFNPKIVSMPLGTFADILTDLDDWLKSYCKNSEILLSKNCDILLLPTRKCVYVRYTKLHIESECLHYYRCLLSQVSSIRSVLSKHFHLFFFPSTCIL
jgi:hypothetical protein